MFEQGEEINEVIGVKTLEKVYFNNWHIAELIGSGAFGSVYKIVREDFGEKYYAAMKVIDIPQSDDEIRMLAQEGMSQADVTEYYTSMAQEIVAEFKLMSKLKGHSNIVSYEDHMVLPKEGGIGWTIQIRMELLTPLPEYAQKNDMSIRDIVTLGIDICRALELCEKNHIIHRDVKPENIFLSENGDFKLGDFGVAKTMEKTMSNLSKKGTRAYMAPELARQELCTENVDIYSLGLVMYRFLNHNRLPFLPLYPEKIRFSDREQAEYLRFSGADVPMPQKGGEKLGKIVVKACEYSPEKRYQRPHELRADLEEIYKEISDESIECKVENVPTFSSHYTATGDEEQTINIFRTAVPSMTSSSERSLGVSEIKEIFEPKKIAEIDASADTGDKGNTGNTGTTNAVTVDGNTSINAKQDYEIESITSMTPPKSKGKGGRAVALVLVFMIAVAGAFYVYLKAPNDETTNFVGMTEEDTVAMLEEKGIDYTLHHKYNDEYNSGKIYKQTPDSIKDLEKGENVSLYVSKGKDTRVEMPYLVGMKKSEATDTLDKLKLKYEIKKKYSTKHKKGRICKQSKKKGKKLQPGDEVTIWVSKGKKSSKSSSSSNSSSSSSGSSGTQVSYVTVPSVTMYTKSDAISMLQNKGLGYSVVTVSNGYPEGIVTGQSVGSGRSVQKGSTITIYVDNGE